MDGILRNIQSKIEKLLQDFPVVAILGARQTGKTTLVKQVAPNWHYVDLENAQDFEQVTHDIQFFFEQYPESVIIDEAQIYPALFQHLRGVIDQDRHHKGRFILTGSSSPELLHNISESLAGRVVTVELGTLKANELAEAPLSSLYSVFQQPLGMENPPEMYLGQPLSHEILQRAWIKGGYPEPVLAENPNFYRIWLDAYRNTYLNRDLAALFPKLNGHAYQRFLGLLANLSGTILNKSNIARALEVSEGSIRNYLHIADGTFLWRQLPSYEKVATKTTVKMPKGHIRDSGLLHHLLKVAEFDLLYQHPVIGHSFEGFVIEEILKGLEASDVTNYDAYFYRTKAGAEIDLVLEGMFGILPIEIKYGVHTPLKQLKTLSQFVEDNHLAYGLLINQSQEARWLTRQIFQLPVTYL